MAEFKVEHKKQQSSEHGTVSQRKGETVLPDNRGQVSQARALTDNRTAQLSSDITAKPNNTGLPNQLKTGIESLSGMSMDHVKVHYNSSQPAQLNAHAYAQGSNIHLAPGQEKHLPHEAWHVVQQAQGRVKPTMQMKAGVPVNDDKSLENEADVMGARALGMHRQPASTEVLRSGPRAAGVAPIQRRTAQQAGLLPTYANAGNTHLYNIDPAKGLTQGILYTITLPAQPNVAAVLHSYTIAARAIGTALHGAEYLDKPVGALPQVPGMGRWAAGLANFNNAITAWAQAAPPFNFIRGQAGHAAASQQRTNLTTNRQASRANAQIGLIDPFVAQITIPQGGHNWIIETNFSNSALGYITKIQAGPAQATGILSATPATFAAVAHVVPPIGAPANYSPDHDTTVNHDVGTQIATIDPAATNQANHPGFDAVTKLGAEGARFEPVRQMGMALKVDSRFYTIDAAGQTKFLTFRELYTNWGGWFMRGYGITAAQVRAQVLVHGTILPGAVTRAHDYDLDGGAAASTRGSAIVARIRSLLLARNWVGLAPLKRMYPDLYRTAQIQLFGTAVIGAAALVGALAWYFRPRK